MFVSKGEVLSARDHIAVLRGHRMLMGAAHGLGRSPVNDSPTRAAAHSRSVPAPASVLALFVSTLGCSAAGGAPMPQGEAQGGAGARSGETNANPMSGGDGGDGPAAGPSGAPTGAGYTSMAPPMLQPIARGPVGRWEYHEIAGAECRDGSPAGFYTRFSDTSTNLVIYLEQGGACFNPALCAYNPATVDERMTGRALSETLVGMQSVRQEPPSTGIFDASRSENPVRDWNMVWVPYCTGDAHAGSRPNAMVPGVAAPQQFVGYLNMQKFVGHIVPTFHDAERVLLTGTSAGSFGAGLNFNQVQDAFGATPVTLLMDSGIPLSDAFMASCLQHTWRDLWNFEVLLPPECTECRNADGGGLIELVLFSARKYAGVRAGVLTPTEDDVMRFFLAFGENQCAGAPSYPEGKYTQALMDLRQLSAPYSAQFSSYYVSGIEHMHLQFDAFYQALSGGVTVADWTRELIGGRIQNVGP
jgi:hypothetical protein